MAQQSLSARRTSNLAGLSDSAVKKILASKGWPNGNTVFKLAKALNTKSDWLMPSPEHISPEEISAAKKCMRLIDDSKHLKRGAKLEIIEAALKELDIAREPIDFTTHENAEIYDEGQGNRQAITGSVIVHLVGYVGGNEGFTPFEDNVQQVLEAPAGTKAGTEAVEIWGDSMAPAFPAGTILFYSQIAYPIYYYIDRPVIVELSDGRRLFKYLKKGTKPGYYSLISGDGSIIESDVKLKTVYPVDMVKY